MELAGVQSLPMTTSNPLHNERQKYVPEQTGIALKKGAKKLYKGNIKTSKTLSKRKFEIQNFRSKIQQLSLSSFERDEQQETLKTRESWKAEVSKEISPGTLARKDKRDA